MSEIIVQRAQTHSAGWLKLDSMITRPEADLGSWLVGSLAMLLALPPGWKLNNTDLQKRFKCSRGKVHDTLNQLVAAGYLIRFRLRLERGRFGPYCYVVFEKPSDALAWLAANPDHAAGVVDSATKAPHGENPPRGQNSPHGEVTTGRYTGHGETSSGETSRLVRHKPESLSDSHLYSLPPSPTRDARADAGGGGTANAVEVDDDDDWKPKSKEEFHAVLRRDARRLNFNPDEVEPKELAPCACHVCAQDRANNPSSAPPATPRPPPVKAAKSAAEVADDERECAYTSFRIVATQHGLPFANNLTQSQRDGLDVIFARFGGWAAWHDAMNVLKDSPWLLGQGRARFKADLDWLVVPKNFKGLHDRVIPDTSGIPF